MAGLQEELISGITKSGIWGVEKADTVIASSAKIVGDFIDGLPDEKRGFAIETLQERIDQSRQGLSGESN